MARSTRLVAWCAVALVAGCPEPGSSERARDGTERAIGGMASEGDHARAATPPAGDAPPAIPSDPRLDAEYPLHGVVTGVQISVREHPEPDAERIGALRIGARVRLKPDRIRTSTCASGWYAVHPRGWACAGLGIEVGEAPPEAAMVVEPPPRDVPLPYAYFFVKQKMTAEYHRPPTRDERRATWAYARRYLELVEEDEARAARMLAGELRNEPDKPGVVRRYMDRGFFIAVPLSDAEGDSEYVRTVRGSYVWRERLERRRGSAFAGVEVTAERPLPIPWMRRTARPRHRRPRSDGTLRWAENPEWEPVERQTIVEGWLRRERFEERTMHVLEGDRYFLAWFIGLADRIDPEVQRRFEFAADEVWIHVDLREGTLMVYRGPDPIYSTLISSGLEGHETPTGFFRVQRKFISDTMANLGPDAGDDRYRIEDVPWTQYFDGNIAIHGAFWHDRFGLERSHGCVNLSPTDAHRVFELTEPQVPPGWHGVEGDRGDNLGSRVIVTR